MITLTFNGEPGSFNLEAATDRLIDLGIDPANLTIMSIPDRSEVTVHIHDDPDGSIQTLVIAEFSNHDPSLTEAQLADAAKELTEANAKADAASIPGWASWTEAEAVAWVDGHVTNLEGAKQALSALSRLVVALRNKTWPGLQGQ
ncbi:MAG: hypothetical protein JXJ17_17065 [Anaerolineae bacterium]|nr:hypothetical protein [Anaerolineae bacterium]